MSQDDIVKRSNLRFSADSESVAQIDLDSSHDKENFEAQFHALVLDESFKGCGLVCLKRTGLTDGTEFLAKIGHLGPIKCKVVYMTIVDDDIIKVGINYLE